MTIDELIDKHITPMRTKRADEAFRADLNLILNETVQLNRIELARDIKRRHWVNEKLRNAYLGAVVDAAKEALEATDGGSDNAS